MKETVEAPNGGHYEKCGQMTRTNESNSIIRVTECTECGHTRVRSSFPTDIVVFITTAVSAMAAFNTEFAVPSDATRTMANVYPALGPILGVLIMLLGAYTFYCLDQGVVIETDGDQR